MSLAERGRIRSPHSSARPIDYGAAGLGAARLAHLAETLGQTGGKTYRQTDGRIAVSLNAPYGGGITRCTANLEHIEVMEFEVK